MPELQLVVSAEERDFLVRFLETALKELSVEEHRTRAPSYRKLVLQDEKLMASILRKLGQPTK
jgi:hypothetical protein